MLWDMLNNYFGHVNVDFVKMMLRFPGSPPPYPPENGWDAKVCRPTNSWVSVVLPDDGDKGIVHICTGPAGVVIHSSTASNGDVMKASYPYINGTHTFFRMNLAKNPKAVVKAAKKNTDEDIAAAYAKLMLLKYNDPGYKVLNDLYSLANTEYYQGCSLFNQGLITEKNEALFYFARAATKLTRAQAHAMQVYNALKPPATSPSDLGLKPFGGGWAKWETEVGKTK